MAYQLKEVVIRTNNSEEGMRQIDEIWQDITAGKLPVLFDSEKNFRHGISPVSKYGNYESDENGEYDLGIMGVTDDFFHELERGVETGKYKKYEAVDDNLRACAQKAWERVWHDQKAGIIKRVFSEDYESPVPAEYAKDGKAHCYLYIAIHRPHSINMLQNIKSAMAKNYFYLIVGFLFVLFAVTHTLNGLGTALPVLDNAMIDGGTKTVFTYVWHVIGMENLVSGIALIIMAFQKSVEKVKFTAWVIIVILILRWIIIAFFTALNDISNVANLLSDTIAISTCVVLLVLGTRVKTKIANE
jgi:predicted transcriptional regulator YdeE